MAQLITISYIVICGSPFTHLATALVSHLVQMTSHQTSRDFHPVSLHLFPRRPVAVRFLR